MSSTLEELLRDNEDDLATMNKFIIYSEDMRLKDATFMETLVSLIPDPASMVTWTQPWYQQYPKLRVPPKQNLVCSDKYRTDKFTTDEHDRMKKNWKKLVKKFGIPDEPVCLARYTKSKVREREVVKINAVRIFVYSYLARGLERPVNQVFHNFNSKYAYTKKGPYTKLEEKAITLCIEQSPYNNSKSVKILSAVLNRHPRHIYNRMKYIQFGKVENVQPRKWNLKRAKKLLKLLLEHTGREVLELKNYKIDNAVWHKMEDALKNKPMNLRRFWYKYLHVQLFVEEDVKYSKIRQKIFKRLKRSEYRVWADIKWNDFVKKFPDGMTPQFLYYCALRSFVGYKQGLRIPLEEACEFALKRRVKHNKRLKRLTYTNNGDLEFVTNTAQ